MPSLRSGRLGASPTDEGQVGEPDLLEDLLLIDVRGALLPGVKLGVLPAKASRGGKGTQQAFIALSRRR